MKILSCAISSKVELETGMFLVKIFVVDVVSWGEDEVWGD